MKNENGVQCFVVVVLLKPFIELAAPPVGKVAPSSSFPWNPTQQLSIKPIWL